MDTALLDEILAAHGRTQDQAIPILQAVQRAFRYVPVEAVIYIAERTDCSEAQLYGVATFYTQFRLEPVGETVIKVCHGTACHVAGAGGITEALEQRLGIKNGETTADGKYTLLSVACLGCCSLAPVVMAGDRTYGRLDRKKAAAIIDEIEQRDATAAEAV